MFQLQVKGWQVTRHAHLPPDVARSYPHLRTCPQEQAKQEKLSSGDLESTPSYRKPAKTPRPAAWTVRATQPSQLPILSRRASLLTGHRASLRRSLGPKARFQSSGPGHILSCLLWLLDLPQTLQTTIKTRLCADAEVSLGRCVQYPRTVFARKSLGMPHTALT